MRHMWFLRTSLLAILLGIMLLAQTTFATIGGPRALAEAIRDARKQLTGRTDPAAMVQWNSILAEMHLAKDPEIKDVLQSLRALNLYDNESWITLVNMGYAYVGDTEGARQFRTELVPNAPILRGRFRQLSSTGSRPTGRVALHHQGSTSGASRA